MNKTLLAIPASILMVNAASAATFFTDSASWATAAGGTVVTETFDGVDATSSVNGSYNAINGTDSLSFDLTATTGGNVLFSASPAFSNGNTGNGIFFGIDPLKTLTFDLDAPASAFSFYGHDLFDTDGGLYSLEIELSYDGGATFVTEFLTDDTDGLGGNGAGEVDFTLSDASTGTIDFGQDNTGNVGDGVFFGFVSTSGITNVRITHNTLVEAGENIGFDQISIVAVPEPSSTALLGLGGLALLARRKRS